MAMTRREFLEGSAALAAVPLLGNHSLGQDDYTDREKGTYAIVASEATARDWSSVVRDLERKYPGSILVKYKDSVNEIVDKVKEAKPRYMAYVAQLSEATPDKIKAASSASRVADAIFGVITGLDSSDASLLASFRGMTLRKALLKGDSAFLTYFPEGKYYSESRQKSWGQKSGRGAKIDDRMDGPADTTETLMREFGNCDYFMTSGHANHNIWESGFNYADGGMISQKGKIYAVDAARLQALKAGNKDANKVGKAWEVDSRNEKVWHAAGNCSIGQINGEDSMVPAAIRWLGVRHMFASLEPVISGGNFQGWGMWPYFRQGRLTMAEAAYAARKSMVYSQDCRRPFINESADSFAFYGDPGAPTRLSLDGTSEFNLKVYRREKGGEWEITAELGVNKPLRGYHLQRPVVIFPKNFTEVTLADASGVEKNRVGLTNGAAVIDLYKGNDRDPIEEGFKATVIVKAKEKK